MSAVVLTWLISGCSLPIWSFLLKYVRLSCPESQKWGAVLHARGFFPLPALQHQLYNKLCCHNWCDIFDGAAASTQEAGVIPERLGKSTGPRVKTSDSTSLGLRFLKSWTRATPSSFPMLSGWWNWELASFPGSWVLLGEFLNVKASIMVPSCRGRGYPWKLFLGQDNCRIAASTQSFVS